MPVVDLETWWSLSYPDGALGGKINYHALSRFVARISSIIPPGDTVAFVRHLDEQNGTGKLLQTMLETEIFPAPATFDALMEETAQHNISQAEELCLHLNAPERLIRHHYRTFYPYAKKKGNLGTVVHSYLANPSTPHNILEEIADDNVSDPNVAYAFVQSLHAPERALARIYRRRILYTLVSFICMLTRVLKPSTYETSYGRWSSDEALYAFARNPHTPQEILIGLSRRGRTRAQAYEWAQTIRQRLWKNELSSREGFQPVSQLNENIFDYLCRNVAVPDRVLKNVQRKHNHYLRSLATLTLEGRA